MSEVINIRKSHRGWGLYYLKKLGAVIALSMLSWTFPLFDAVSYTNFIVFAHSGVSERLSAIKSV